MSPLQRSTSFFRMVFPSKQKNSAPDTENTGIQQHGGPDAAASPSQPPVQNDATYSRLELDPSDSLNLFRHLVGITSHPSMAHSDSFFSPGGRPAPNLGIYARVVHNEQTAKSGYKYFSWLINGCLGLQIVIAATLTALGAAGGSRSAVTVFGAVNTVFAGILAFLKGSGLPNRLKYYQTEWKRVREFIEQRERDFGRPNCDLDVHSVGAMVESMYEEVKMDLEASTPDRFAGANSTRKSTIHAAQTPTYKFPSMSLSQAEVLNEKGQETGSGFGSKVKTLASEITHYAQQAREVAKDLQTQKENITEGASKEVKELAGRVERSEHALGDRVKDLSAEIGQRAHMAEQMVHDAERRAVDGTVQEARDHLARVEAAARSKLTNPFTIKILHSGSAGTEQEGKKLAEDY